MREGGRGGSLLGDVWRCCGVLGGRGWSFEALREAGAVAGVKGKYVLGLSLEIWIDCLGGMSAIIVGQ